MSSDTTVQGIVRAVLAFWLHLLHYSLFWSNIARVSTCDSDSQSASVLSSFAAMSL